MLQLVTDHLIWYGLLCMNEYKIKECMKLCEKKGVEDKVSGVKDVSIWKERNNDIGE